jgi:sulfate permease, SulP family
MLGGVLIVLAVAVGASLATALSGFPVPILAGLLTVAGIMHIALLKDLRGPAQWALALAVGVTGLLSNLAVALVGALVIWWATRWVQARKARRTGGDATPRPPTDSEPGQAN